MSQTKKKKSISTKISGLHSAAVQQEGKHSRHFWLWPIGPLCLHPVGLFNNPSKSKFVCVVCMETNEGGSSFTRCMHFSSLTRHKTRRHGDRSTSGSRSFVSTLATLCASRFQKYLLHHMDYYFLFTAAWHLICLKAPAIVHSCMILTPVLCIMFEINTVNVVVLYFSSSQNLPLLYFFLLLSGQVNQFYSFKLSEHSSFCITQNATRTLQTYQKSTMDSKHSA